MQVSVMRVECVGNLCTREPASGASRNGFKVGVFAGGDRLQQGSVGCAVDFAVLIVRESFGKRGSVARESGIVDV